MAIFIGCNRYIIKSLMRKKAVLLSGSTELYSVLEKKSANYNRNSDSCSISSLRCWFFFEAYSTQSIFVRQPNGLGLGIQQIILLCHKNTAVQLITTVQPKYKTTMKTVMSCYYSKISMTKK